MLEILYDTTTMLVAAWCADPSQFGNFTPTPEQDIVIFPIDPPSAPSDWYKVDLVKRTIEVNPDYDPLSPDIRAACAILSHNPDVITNPQMRQLQGIWGRLLGVPD